MAAAACAPQSEQQVTVRRLDGDLSADGRLQRLMADACRIASIPVPRMAVIETERVAAYTLRDYVFVSEGALGLPDDELSALCCHEIAHIFLGHASLGSVTQEFESIVVSYASSLICRTLIPNDAHKPPLNKIAGMFEVAEELEADKAALRVMEGLGLNRSPAASLRRVIEECLDGESTRADRAAVAIRLDALAAVSSENRRGGPAK